MTHVCAHITHICAYMCLYWPRFFPDQVVGSGRICPMLAQLDRQLGLTSQDYSQQVVAFGQIIPRTWSLLAVMWPICHKLFPADLSQFVDIWPCFGHWKPKSLVNCQDYSQIIPSRFVAICRNCSHKMVHLDGKSIAKWSNCSQIVPRRFLHFGQTAI